MQVKNVIITVLIAVLVSVSTVWYLFNNHTPITEIIRVNDDQPANFISLHDFQDYVGEQPVDFRVAAARTTPTVVHIRTAGTVEQPSSQNPFRDFFGEDFFGPRQQQPQQRQRRGSGSGVIVSDDGFIVTNNHVIRNASEIEVTLHNNRTYMAEVVGTDPSTDIALIKIEAEQLPYIYFADSDLVEVGEWVLAVGNPFNLSSTVTAGIVSAKARNINILREQTSIESFIQTDAAVNPGNSGGALVNMDGKLIGINTAIATNTGSFAGYSFAVPANLVQKIVLDLKDFGIVQRGFLGVTIRNVNSELAGELNLQEVRGVYIENVGSGSAAEKAGLKKGDVITHVNDAEVNTSPELQEQVARYRPGDEISVEFFRNGRRLSVNAVLHNMNQEPELLTRTKVDVIEMLGAELANLTDEEKKQLGIDEGVKVSSLQRNGLLRTKTDIREGFIITHINKRPVKQVEDVVSALEGKSGGVLVEGIYPDRPQRHYYAFGL